MKIEQVQPITFAALTRTDLVRYAGASGDFNPLHHDAEFAEASGLKDVMGHGMLSAGLLASALTKWFGPGSVLRFKTRFKSPVWPGDVLTARCLSIVTNPEGAHLVLELIRGADDVVLTATASVRLDIGNKR
jgi:3-hydroxybutyryl-CoA dehydratase